ncbi:MAG TPA: T9SS type A sorting domain-containing protein, partial [Chitinophagales bacterium]|nr:T9SS type A sorting domain-containing protein [Chitinophagales bacterium]
IQASSEVAIITPLGNLEICQAGAVILQAKPGPAYKYQWIKGSVSIAGATNASYTATTTAVYKVKVTGSNGCGTTSAGTKVTKSCKEEDGTISPKPDNFDFYPNPTDGRFIIVLSNEAYQHPDGSVPVLIEIRNALGELVYYDKTIKEESNFQREISLSKGLPPGIYFIRLVMPDKVFERKMVYQK